MLGDDSAITPISTTGARRGVLSPVRRPPPDVPTGLLANLAILVLAGFVGFAVISRFPTPAPADVGYHAIHGIVVLGAAGGARPAPGDAGWGVHHHRSSRWCSARST